MNITLPNEHWEFDTLDDGELNFTRRNEDPNSDTVLHLTLDPALGEYHIFFTQGADYLGHFGTHTKDGAWKGTKKDTERLLRAAEGMYSVWSKETPGLRENKRPVPVDPWLVKRVEGAIYDEVEDWIKKLGKKRFMRKKLEDIVDIRGKKKPFSIQVDKVSGKNRYIYKEMVHGGSYIPAKNLLRVKVHTPSVQHWFIEKSMETFRKELMKEIHDVVIHELTHAVDVIDPKGIKRARRGRVVQDDYLNSPHEVRAYGRMIAEEVEDYLIDHPEILVGGNAGANLVHVVQKVSTDRGLFYFRMDRENRKLILKMVTGYLRDKGLL